jgi:hypothetical protein
VDHSEETRLQAGGHRRGKHGVCVVEYASLLAGERLSDHPDCVCPVIAAFLRCWNDRVSYVERQYLRPYAERIVGTADDRALSRRRQDLCLEHAGADLSGGPISRSVVRLRMRVRIGLARGLMSAIRLKRGAAVHAALLCYERDDPEEAFALLDWLLVVGRRSSSVPDDGGGRRVPLRVLATIKAIQSPAGGDGAVYPPLGELVRGERPRAFRG